MREILFRGKRPDNNEWEYGSIVVLDEDCQYIIPKYELASSLSKLDIMKLTAVYVRANTISQFTGMTDKNGEMIFEGDIIRRLDVIQVERETGRVAFDEVCCCFYLTVNGGIGRRGIFRDAKYEIIGNIHDNPELLEVSK